MNSTSRIPPLSDSPWFWFVIFGVCAMLGLVAISPKYLVRQQRIEANHAGRTRGWLGQQGHPDDLAAEVRGDSDGEVTTFRAIHQPGQHPRSIIAVLLVTALVLTRYAMWRLMFLPSHTGSAGEAS